MTITFGELESIDTAAHANLALLLSLDASATAPAPPKTVTDGFVELGFLLGIDARSTNLLAGYADTDVGFALSLDALGYALAPTTSTAANTTLDFTMSFDGTADQQSDSIVPTLPASVDVDFVLHSDATLVPVLHVQVETDVEFALSVEALPANYAEVEFLLSLDARSALVPSAYGMLVERPAEITAYGNVFFETFTSTVVADAATVDEVVLLFRSVASVAGSASWLGQLEMTLQSSITARAIFAVLLETSFTDTVLATAQLDALPRALLSLADQMVVMGEVSNQLDALIALTSALVANDTTTYGTDLDVESEVAATDAFAEMFNAVMALVSEVDATDETTVGAGFTFLLSDAVDAADTAENSVAALIELLDSANVTARFNLPGNDGGLYVGYAMNVRTGAMTRYDNYPFVGFATVGTLPLAIGEEGLYALQGNDDAGEPIHAAIRTGLTDFGTQMLKHSPNAYIGYTADGALLLKVITTDGGRKKANCYRLRPRTSPAPTTDRFSIAKGLTAVYWGYQIENIDGADFELDTVKVWPFPVQRRKSGR